MELLLSELQKRDVINMVDGRWLGRITDILFDFPAGRIKDIVVPGRCNRGLLKFFDRNRLTIPEKNIVKIGGDVILVNLQCGQTCLESTPVDSKPTTPKQEKCNICDIDLSDY